MTDEEILDRVATTWGGECVSSEDAWREAIRLARVDERERLRERVESLSPGTVAALRVKRDVLRELS